MELMAMDELLNLAPQHLSHAVQHAGHLQPASALHELCGHGVPAAVSAALLHLPAPLHLNFHSSTTYGTVITC